VTNNNDSGPGSLRQLLLEVSDRDRVNFAPNVTGTITLTSGELGIRRSVALNDPGPKALTVSGSNISRIF
jgi:hypothetical protein